MTLLISLSIDYGQGVLLLSLPASLPYAGPGTWKELTVGVIEQAEDGRKKIHVLPSPVNCNQVTYPDIMVERYRPGERERRMPPPLITSFLSPCPLAEQRQLVLAEKFKELKRSKRLESFLSRKRRRNAGKDRRHLPLSKE